MLSERCKSSWPNLEH